MLRKPVAVIIVLNLLASPALLCAGPTIPGFHGAVSLPTPPAVNTLPSPRGNAWTGVGNITTDTSTNRMVINQTQPRATIDWNSFDIGANASVHFNQKNEEGVAQKDWAALNRIYDRNPSQIYGSLTADGKVYLINQNGILFGPGSRVSVHSLIASTLNLRDKDFLGGLLRFTAENYQSAEYKDVSNELFSSDPEAYNANLKANLLLSSPDSSAAVSNFGTIATGEGGYVYLIGPLVDNVGEIVAPSGNIGLLTALPFNSRPTEEDGQIDYDIEISDDSAGRKIIHYHKYLSGGEAANYETGRLISDAGKVGMYGRIVNQDGVVRAVTAVKRNGIIELLATEKVTTGANSVTASPVSDSPDTAHESFIFKGGEIRLGGLNRMYMSTDGVKLDATPYAVNNIEHRGSIEAPSALAVSLEASERIFLENGSSINVSGLWVDMPASSSVVEATLNSVNLKDEFSQKSGILLGEKIQVNTLAGSNIGDVSGYLNVEEMNARQRSVSGGVISIGSEVSGVNTAEIVVKGGAEINFSGGGYNYEAGVITTTKLLCGNTAYDISTAPATYAFSRILGAQQVAYQRFGKTETFEGFYLGGANPVGDLTSAHVQGSDAGSLALMGRTVVLDGTLNGSVTRGVFQTKASDPTDFLSNLEATGLREPVGGVLTIGADQTKRISSEGDATTYYDSVVDSVTVQARTTPLSDMFGADEALPVTRKDVTYLSAELLNSIGLSSLTIHANLSVTTESDASLTLRAFNSSKTVDGTTTAIRPEITLSARRIEHFGEISVPGGTVNLLNPNKNITTFEHFRDSAGSENARYVDLDGRIFLADGSVVSTAGEKVDNSLSGRGSDGTVVTPHIKGGDITIADNEKLLEGRGEGIIVKQGALVDVGGGYEIDGKGKAKGGDAGTLTLAGRAVVLNGELNGTALAGAKGGKIVMEAENVELSRFDATLGSDFRAWSPLPEFFQDRLILTGNRLEDTGFTQIEARSFNDVTVEAGVTLAPSLYRLAAPTAGSTSGSTNVANGETALAETSSRTVVAPEYVGTSSITLQAGLLHTEDNEQAETDLSRVVIAVGSSLEAAPGGKVTVKGPIVDIEGAVSAPGGEITAQSTRGELTLGEWSRLLAAGYNKPSTATVAGVAVGPTPQDGGKVNLTALSLVMEKGALVDVSGGPSVTNTIKAADGTPSEVQVASNPGSVSISYTNELFLDGELRARALLPGLKGGSLSIARTDLNNGLTVTAEAVDRYQRSGFDDLTFASVARLEFAGDTGLSVGRKLTLDAPEIYGSGVDWVTLRAPWIRLTNSYYPSSSGTSEGSAELRLSAQWLDVEGSVRLSGFRDARLEARNDLTFTDRYYDDPVGDNDRTSGELRTPGDLTLAATRIYPTTQSNFTVHAAGKITTLPGEGTAEDTIYSAMGSLTLEAENGIEHGGYLAAPLGIITLDGMGKRVLLAEGSTLSTAASVNVNLGVLKDSDLSWWLTDRSTSRNLTEAFTDTPNSITVKSDTTDAQGEVIAQGDVIVNDGAKIDVSGGGSVFAYLFTPGLEGSINPIARTVKDSTGARIRSDRYVILPDNSVQMPGETIYLEADETLGLKAGFYSILPEQFAFRSGALVVSSLGSGVASGEHFVTAEGYRVVPGYFSISGTEIHPASLNAYSVRRATDVLKEGHFDVKQMVAGNAGALSVSGSTTIFEGDVAAAPLSGYLGGSLSLSSKEINVIAGAFEEAGTPYYFETMIPEAVAGKMRVSDILLSGTGFASVTLGGTGTESITLRQGSAVTASSVTLAAKTGITLEDSSRIEAVTTDGSGTITLSTDGGVTTAAGSILRASGEIKIKTAGIDLKGEMETPALSLESGTGRMFLTADEKGDDGLYLTEQIWKRFASVDSLELIGASGIRFMTSVTLAQKDSLTLDTGLIEATGGSEVSLSASRLALKNSANHLSSTSGMQDTGTLSLAANDLSVDVGAKTSAGKWNILLDGFGDVSLTAENDLTFQGLGTLKTQGNLSLTAARITTGAYSDSTASFRASKVVVDAAGGTVTTALASGEAGTTAVAGGRLEINATNINHGGFIDLPSGQLVMNASETISLAENSSILARGSRIATAKENQYYHAPGGSITLKSKKLSMSSGSLLDVSAHPEQGDAGSILIAASDSLDLQGSLMGAKGEGGTGGSFTLDAGNMEFDTLYAQLSAGGFDNTLDIKARQGDVVIDTTVSARRFRLAADGGDITLGSEGRIDVSGAAGGGIVELYAKNNLTLESGSSINASGTGAGADGGEVILSSYFAGGFGADGNPTGGILFADGAAIDVSGYVPGKVKDDVSGESGRVHFRARRNTNDNTATDMNLVMGGTVTGAASITAEAVRVYDNVTSIGSTQITAWKGQTGSFMSAALDTGNMHSAINRLGQSGNDLFTILPGLEIRSTGNITLATNWNLSSPDWHFGYHAPTAESPAGTPGAPGVLTLRAAGNLAVNNDLIDHPVSNSFDVSGPEYKADSVRKSPVIDSWGFNLVAGADMAGADYMAITPSGAGDFTIASNKLVYTESGPIRFASANNTTINKGSLSRTDIIQNNLVASMANYDAAIKGVVGGNLSMPGGVIQSATGDIDIIVGGNLAFSDTDGAIRTTGQPGADLLRYGDGGDISVEVARNISGGFNSKIKYGSVLNDDGTAFFQAKYDNEGVPRGLATMGGGTLSVYSGGDFDSQACAMGKGDLRVRSDGDMKGVFLVREGTAELAAMGNFGLAGTGTAAPHPVIEMMDAVVSVTAQGDINLGTVLNPTMTNTATLLSGGFEDWFMTYSRDAAVSFFSLNGDVTLYGDLYKYKNSTYPILLGVSKLKTNQIFPQSLDIVAARDINLMSSLSLAPSSRGNLDLFAGRDINGSKRADGSWQVVSMLDTAEEEFYRQPALIIDVNGNIIKLNTGENHPLGGSAKYSHGYSLVFDQESDSYLYKPLHDGDVNPVVVSARGDISEMQLLLPKRAEVTAGHDIRDIHLVGQNLEADDVTLLNAGHDILLTLAYEGAGGMNSSGVELGGPGYFMLQAGNLIDLANSKGVQTFGNRRNAYLPEEGADLILISGYTKDFNAPEMSGFFDELRTAGNEYSELLSQGETAKAADRVRKTREEIIAPFLTESAGDGAGTITMTSSQMSTNAPGSDMFILTRGTVDVGKSAIELDKSKAEENAKKSGIFTSQGGGINIYTGGDLNVNESKVMTFFGGDITVWSEKDINAGRGSRTAVSASPPYFKTQIINGEKVQVLVFGPPAAGSGIRAVTYDPNSTPGGDLSTPEPGNIYMFAPQGVIDAGEAGIAGGKVVLGATEVLNARNISFSAGSVGVPVSSDTSVSLGALSGSSALTENNKMIEQTALGASKSLADSVADKVGQLMSGWLDVKVISFDEEEEKKE